MDLQDGVCYLFGKNATGAKRTSSEEEKKNGITSTQHLKNIDETLILLGN